MHTSPIADALSSVVPGPPITFRNLPMIPLLGRAAQPGVGPASSSPSYLVLDEAMAAGVVEVTEVSEHGSVPELRVVNRGQQPTLIVDGEELIGAKQNRVVNLTILVAAHSTLTIPVSCVEAGRWRARSRTFSSAPRTQYASGRVRRMAQVTESIANAGRYYSNQAEVWADIAEKSVRLNASSPTGAMEALFTGHSDFVDRCVAACQAVPGQRGALFAVNGRIIGFDLFDSAASLARLLPKLVRSVAIDALDAEQSELAGDDRSGNPRPSAELFLQAVQEASCHSTPAVGVGEDLRLTAPGLTGAALVAGGGVLHLSAFALPDRR